jgi:hypothetical protein
VITVALPRELLPAPTVDERIPREEPSPSPCLVDAITGGIGRVSRIVLATVLIVWMNAGIRLAFERNAGAQYQLLALGVLLVFAALLNGFALRRYVGSQEVASGCHR